MKFDLAFGNSVAVRKAFLETYKGNFIVFTQDTLEQFDYPAHLGDPELIKTTKEVIKRQTGQKYKHIILTNGATGAINIVLSVYRLLGVDSCLTRKAPYYMRYPTMVTSTGMVFLTENDDLNVWSPVCLVDIPSNPLNLTNNIIDDKAPTILDGVYLSNVYTHGNVKLPKHDVFIASYSKLTGLNGLRVGFIATNNDLLYERFKEFTIAAYCGLSKADALIANQLLYDLDWERFETKAKDVLNLNREEISKLEKYMGNTPVQDVGMFWYAPMDKQCQKLFEKSGVEWTKGNDLGTNNDFGRLNVGQDREIIRNAVKSVLKNDHKET